METKKEKQERRKTSKLKLARRIRIVQDWIMQDHLTPDIISQAIAQWSISERQAYRYLWAANKFFREKQRQNLEEKIAYYLARKKKLLRDMNSDEKKTAAGVRAIDGVLNSMAKLEGVSLETLKLVGDPSQPVRTISEVVSAQSVDYTKLPTEFLEMLVNSRKTA